MGGIWESISSGEMPSMDDVYETGAGIYEDAGDAYNYGEELVSDGADYATELGHDAYDLGAEAYGYGERAYEASEQFVVDTADDAYHGLTDWHFEDRDALNGPAPSLDELEDPNGPWVEQPDWMADLHQDESHDGREAKYVNPDGRESIRYRNYDEDGGHTDDGEVTEGRYKGTYNYVNPGVWDGDLENQGQVFGVPVGGAAEWGARFIGHGVADVAPWLLGGSVRGDG